MELTEVLKAQNLTTSELGDINDGQNTFNNLYHQRRILFTALCNTFPELAWKSKKHEDGADCFDGESFIVGIDAPAGPCAYHFKIKYWDMFHCKELKVGKPYDGRANKNVDRLLSLEDYEIPLGDLLAMVQEQQGLQWLI